MYICISFHSSGGAQKNVGIAGLTIGIVRDDMLSVKDRKGTYSDMHVSYNPNYKYIGGHNWKNFLPSVFDWKKMIEAESCLNTPPVYAIYMAGLCFDWLVRLHVQHYISLIVTHAFYADQHRRHGGDRPKERT